MRILIGMPDREAVGGPVACEPPFVEELRRRGVQVEEEIYVHADKQSENRLGKRIVRVMLTARRLRQRLGAEHFDVIHLNTSFDLKALLRDIVTISFLRSSNSKIFLKFHGSDPDLLRRSNVVWRFLGKFLLARADAIGVLSSEEKENFVRAGVDEHKIFVVKNVVKKAGDQHGYAFAARMKIDAGTPKLLFISRFIPAKGLVDVIRACRIVRDRGQQFVLLCVGDGPARAEAEEEVMKQGLQAAVRFLGLIPEEQAADFYAQSTMLVFPTYHIEGFPMVIFNSVAAGLPIITTRIRAAADYLREPDNCLWIEPKNPEMLAERIIYLLRHSDVRATMRRNNEKLAQRFSAEFVTQEYLEIYKQLITEKTTNALSGG